MTEAEYVAQLEACNWSEPAVSELVSSSYTNVMFNEKVQEMHVNSPLGAYNFFSGFFGSEVWQDGQGDDEIREYATDPYIPFTFSHFVKQAPVCNPNYAGNCDADFCEVPEGGKGTFPGMQWVKWAFETKRTCIADIRSLRKFQYWAARAIRFRQLIDEQVMNMFYVMVAIKTLGHKVTLNATRDNGLLNLITNSNPRNLAGYGSYNYMQERFPEIMNVNNLVPIQFSLLEKIARRWSRHPSADSTRVGTGPRGENIYEMWHPDDIYAEEVYKNPDYMKSLRYTLPSSQFAGYSLAPGEQEIIGNWKFKVMPWLPRFAPTASGAIVPVDSHVDVPIEVGNEPVPNPLFEDAPIGLAMIISGKMGTILTRPTLTQSGDGAPILPIASSEAWQINNHYDATCNKLLNKPFFFKRYEMGWRLDNPNAGMGFLFRRRVFSPIPITDCDLAPVFITQDNAIDCPFTTIGCAPKSRENDDITQPTGAPTLVECVTAECGNSGSPWRYNIRVKRIANNPGYNSLGCECGSNVTLHVYNNDNPLTPVRQQQGILKSDIKGFPYGIYVVSTTTEIATNECIRYISCSDETPLFANVITSWDQTENPDFGEGVGVVLDGPMGCDSDGDDVTVRYYDANGVVLDSITATIAEIDIEDNRYRLTSVDPNFTSLASSALVGVVSMGVSCAESPNASSSSSGS